MGILRSGAKTTGPPTGRLVRDGRSRTSGARRVARLGHAMTSALPPAELLEGVVRVLEPAFRLDRLVAATAERVGYHAWDRVLKRHVALHAEHAHARGVIRRRIVPLTLMLELSGRAVITDLRYANWCLPYVPPEERGAGGAFVAPEVRAGGPGEPASDVYAVAALVYYVLTGHEPDADPARVVPPRQLRPAVPAALERVLLRALRAAPSDRYYTATEMLEDFVSDAGVFHEPAATPHVA